MGILNGKRVVLGVAGSIANYKIVELARQLTVAGAIVDVVMTDEATRFVTPLTFESLTYRPVYTEMWSTVENAAAHVKLGEEAHVVLIAPATAHTIAAIAAGLADFDDPDDGAGHTRSGDAGSGDERQYVAQRRHPG